MATMTDTAPDSRQAFHELLDLLREIGDTHFTPAARRDRGGDAAPRRTASCCTCSPPAPSITSRAIPSDRCFTRIVSPQRKLLGDNPDAIYYWTRIDGARSYRIRGATSRARPTRRSPCTVAIPPAAAWNA